MPDVIKTLQDPVNSINGGDYSIWPTYLIAAVHTYHCIAFDNLSVGDWVHHLLFGGVICTCGLLFKCGTILGPLAFNLSGFPGGAERFRLQMMICRPCLALQQ